MTSDVTLRAVSATDLPVFFEQQRDPQANLMAAFPARDQEEFMAHWLKIMADATVTAKTIVVADQVAGHVVSYESSGRRLIGYWLGKEHWGKGIASRALADFLHHVQVRPLHAYVAKHNAASVRVLEKCGFRLCGEGRVFSAPHGVEVDDLIMVLT